MSLTEIGKNMIINTKHRAGRFVEFIEAALQFYIYRISSVCTVLCREDGGGVWNLVLCQKVCFCTQNKDISVMQLFVA